jgi:hypothetical protein
MGAGTGWFHANYWHANYWHANYWAPTGSVEGDYWHNNYWHANYWHSNYWAKSGDIGDVLVTDVWDLSLNKFVAQVATGPFILAGTGARTLNAFSVDGVFGVDPPISLGQLTLTPYDPVIGVSGYVLGDVQVTFSPESAITITYGMVPGAGSRTISAFHPTTSTENGLDVGVGTPGDLLLTKFDVLATNNVVVQPVPATRTITAYNSPAAGIGELIRVQTAPLNFATATHTITGVPIADIRVTATSQLPSSGFTHDVFGRRGLFIPPPTWEGDDSITNDNADTYPSNYEICDRTGFKLRRGNLVKEWTGAMVRKESWERRHIQDFVRGVSDDLEGSPRPEQTDRFVNEEYPQGVTADDL